MNGNNASLTRAERTAFEYTGQPYKVIPKTSETSMVCIYKPLIYNDDVLYMYCTMYPDGSTTIEIDHQKDKNVPQSTDIYVLQKDCNTIPYHPIDGE